MTRGTATVLGVALAAAVLGVVAGLLVDGGGPFWRSPWGQSLLERHARAGGKAPPGVTVADVGDLAPAIDLPRLDGTRMALPADTLGRPLVINVWASWCGPCVVEMPELARYAREQGANGVQVVGIALDDAASVRDFLARVPVGYPIVLDTAGPSDAGVRLGNVRGVLPYTVLLDADGRIAKRKVGPFVPGEIEGWAASP